jgi:hypothetical protein
MNLGGAIRSIANVSSLGSVYKGSSPGVFGGNTVGDLLTGGAVSNTENVNATNATNVQIARENREWQEKMSNSAYQRKMADLNKSGLNPMLAMGIGSAGASTPAGNIATVSPSKPGSKAAGVLANIERVAGLNIAKKQAEVLGETAKKVKKEREILNNQKSVSDAGVDMQKLMAPLNPLIDKMLQGVQTGAIGAGAYHMMKDKPKGSTWTKGRGMVPNMSMLPPIDLKDRPKHKFMTPYERKWRKKKGY